ncbi:MAG: hypothetical protein HY235_01925 [Acidobacteria bacterium]|nr:hypothetical protein [Acidobacteriota bacterium]
MGRLLCLVAFLIIQAARAQIGTTYYVIQTVAGTYSLGDNGPARDAMLFGPRAMCIDRAGNIYVADERNSRIRKIAPGGIITTLARNIEAIDIVCDAAGENFYVLTGNYIYRINSQGGIGVYAGDGRAAFFGDGGPANKASFDALGIALDEQGALYIADSWNDRIRKISRDGVISTIAGTANFGFGGDGEPATGARLNFPYGIAVDRGGAIYIGDTGNHRIRRIDANGIIRTIAGSGNAGASGDGGAATLAMLRFPSRIAVDSSGNTYFTDDDNRIRRITPASIISAFAGTGEYGFAGDKEDAVKARLNGFNSPLGIAVDSRSNVYIADVDNDRIRVVDSSGKIDSIAGVLHYAGDGGQATRAVMKFPTGVVVDRSGTIYITDTENHRIRSVSPQGIINTFLGSGLSAYQDGPVAAAQTPYPRGLISDGGSTLYFADFSKIRKITAAGSVATVAGTGTRGFGGDDSLATVARLNRPYNIAIDAENNIYFADNLNHRVRKVTADGTISTVAGNGNAGFSGDFGPAKNARLLFPRGVALDRNGVLYIADTVNNRIRVVDKSGVITTFAGTGECCSSGDNGPASKAKLGLPTGLVFDAQGNLLIAEWDGNQVRRVDRNGVITTIAGTGQAGFSGDGGLAVLAELDGPASMFLDGNGVIFFTDQYNHRVRRLTPLTPAVLSMVSGDGQSAPAGAALQAPLIVKVAARDGVGVPGVQVTFTVVAGAARLSADTVVTGFDGTASVQVTLGAGEGEVRIRAIAPLLQEVVFRLTATPPPSTGPPPPRILPGGISSGGGSVPPLRMLAVNSQAIIEGENFAAASRTLVAVDLVDGRLPASLLDVCVTFGGVAAPIFMVTPARLGVVVPDVGAGDLPVQVIGNCGRGEERRSNTEIATVQANSPEFYYGGNPQDGKRPVLIRDTDGNRLSGASPSSIILLTLTGLGPSSPLVIPGEVAPQGAVLLETPRVTIAGTELAPENILGAGPSPSFPGLYDLRLQLAADLAEGDQPISASVGGVSTPDGAVLPVRMNPAPAGTFRRLPRAERVVPIPVR